MMFWPELLSVSSPYPSSHKIIRERDVILKGLGDHVGCLMQSLTRQERCRGKQRLCEVLRHRVSIQTP